MDIESGILHFIDDVIYKVIESVDRMKDGMIDRLPIEDILQPLFERIKSLEDERHVVLQDIAKTTTELSQLKPQRQDAETDQPVLPDREIKIFRIVKKPKRRLQDTREVNKNACPSTSTDQSIQAHASNDDTIDKTTSVVIEQIVNTDHVKSVFEDLIEETGLDYEEEPELVDTIIEVNNQVSLAEMKELYATERDDNHSAFDSIKDLNNESVTFQGTDTTSEIRQSDISNVPLNTHLNLPVFRFGELIPYSQSPGFISWRSLGSSVEPRLPQRSQSLVGQTIEKELPKAVSSHAIEKPQSISQSSSGKRGRPRKHFIPSSNPKEILRSSLKALLLILKSKDKDEVFHWPVDTNYVKDYLLYVKNPMDFSTMDKKINRGDYKSLRDFVMDFNLIITNCESYNDPETIYYKTAQKLRVEAVPLIESTGDQIKMAAGRDVDEAIKCPCSVHDPHFKSRPGAKRRRCILDPGNNSQNHTSVPPVSPNASSTTSRPPSVASNSTSTSNARKRHKSVQNRRKYVDSDPDNMSDSGSRASVKPPILVDLDSDFDDGSYLTKKTDKKTGDNSKEVTQAVSGESKDEELPKETETNPETEEPVLVESDDEGDEPMELINPFTGMIETSSRKATVDDLQPVELINPFTGIIEESTATETVDELKQRAEDASCLAFNIHVEEDPFAALFNWHYCQEPRASSISEPLSQSTIEATLAQLVTPSSAQRVVQPQTPETPSNLFESCMFEQWTPRMTRSQLRQNFTPVLTTSAAQLPQESISSLEVCNPMLPVIYSNQTDDNMYGSIYLSSSSNFVQNAGNLSFQDLEDERLDFENPLNCKCPIHDPNRGRVRGRKPKCLYQ